MYSKWLLMILLKKDRQSSICKRKCKKKRKMNMFDLVSRSIKGNLPIRQFKEGKL